MGRLGLETKRVGSNVVGSVWMAGSVGAKIVSWCSDFRMEDGEGVS